MAAAVPMATLGIFGLSNVIIQPINTSSPMTLD